MVTGTMVFCINGCWCYKLMLVYKNFGYDPKRTSVVCFLFFFVCVFINFFMRRCFVKEVAFYAQNCLVLKDIW